MAAITRKIGLAAMVALSAAHAVLAAPMIVLIWLKVLKPATNVPITPAAAAIAGPNFSKNATTRDTAGGTVVVSQSMRAWRRGRISVWNTAAACLIFGTTVAWMRAAKSWRAGIATSFAHVESDSSAGTRCSTAADARAVTMGRTSVPALAAKSPKCALRTCT